MVLIYCILIIFFQIRKKMIVIALSFCIFNTKFARSVNSMVLYG